MSLQKLKQRALDNPEVKAEYEQLEAEFNFIDQLLSMRTKAWAYARTGCTQRMQTQKSNISRLEKGNSNPSWSTLVKYAHACGFELSIKSHKI